MTPELPPRNWVVVDQNTTRLATDEEYAMYLSVILGQEGLVVLPTEPPRLPVETAGGDDAD
jgi:hypothetical protein